MQHTIETIAQLSTTPQLSTLNLSAGKEAVQSQAKQVITQRSENSIRVEQAFNTSPTDLLLQHLEIEVRGSEQDRCRAS